MCVRVRVCVGMFVGVRGSAVDILEWAKERGTRFYSLSVTGDDVLERGLKATVCVS